MRKHYIECDFCGGSVRDDWYWKLCHPPNSKGVDRHLCVKCMNDVEAMFKEKFPSPWEEQMKQQVVDGIIKEEK